MITITTNKINMKKTYNYPKKYLFTDRYEYHTNIYIIPVWLRLADGMPPII